VGIYKGENSFDLRADPDKPIVLYGGINGAGKTTLFESIPLCLYGQNFGTKKITKKQYHDKIYRLFHRNKAHTAVRDASVALEFEYASDGKIDTYRITRLWQNNYGKIEEFIKLETRIRGTDRWAFADLDDVGIQDTINHMIPRGIAEMFFFDGEKIHNIAKSGHENIHIKSSFDSLLGLDIPNQLYDDIGLYVLRNSDDSSNALLAELERKNEEKKRIERKLDSTSERQVFLESAIERRRKDLASLEERFFKMGGRFAQQRQQLVNEKTEWEKNIAFIQANLTHIIEQNLHLALVPKQLEQIRKELESDKKKIQEIFAKDTLDAAFLDLINQFMPLLEQYDAKVRADISNKLDQIMQEKLGSISRKKKPTFDFSLSEMNTLIARIDSLTNGKNLIKTYRKAHLEIKKKLDTINASLSVAPEQDESGPVYSMIKEVTLEIGESEQELLTLKRIAAQEKSLLTSINADIRKCLKRKKSDQKNLRGMAMAPRIQEVLEDYSSRLRAQKIRLLESNILKGIQKFFHKNLIARVSIDSETYQVTLYQDNGEEVTRGQLSKGELQMYATAIVWGLAKTSGWPLPFVIDTPLARLDTQHRENLIQSFYPTASHQSIIFSTDTEITKRYFEVLRPHLAQAHLIRYDEEKDCSMNVDGYFGGECIAVN